MKVAGPDPVQLARGAGESEALIFTKVDCVSRCTEDFARLIRLSEEQGWRGYRQRAAYAPPPHETVTTSQTH